MPSYTTLVFADRSLHDKQVRVLRARHERRADIAQRLAQLRTRAREAVLDKDRLQLLLVRLVRQAPSAPDEHDERLALAGLAERGGQRVLEDGVQGRGGVELAEVDSVERVLEDFWQGLRRGRCIASPRNVVRRVGSQLCLRVVWIHSVQTRGSTL